MARIAVSIIARGRLIARAKLATCILASAIVVSSALDLRLAAAQGVIADGNAVVTGFSGMQLPTLIRSGTDPAERATIDLNGPVLRVIDLQAPGAAPQAQVLTAAKPFTIAARQIGQVFAVVLDNASPPNIYAAATSVYGLPIVVPDVDGDGVPDRWEEGTVNASFMSGLFGPRQTGGGPGSIWRIDGATGAVGLFANVTLDGTPNSGAALGGLAFDRITNTFFVADRETGLIHRFDQNGSERGRYDHGTHGRPAAGLPAVSFDPAKRLVITRPPFQPANPESWGYALPQRRVFGLAVHEGRLYYAVAENLQVWSVAITPDGFGTDARIEVTVSPSQSASEISKIAFDDRGRMLLAERSAPTGAFDFTALTEESGGRVLRYAQTPSTTGPAWQPTPDEYAIGFAAQMRGNGGVAVGYGYDANGRLDRNACSGFVWSTGEQLRVASDATQAAQLAPGGPAIVNGLQGTSIDLVRASNLPRRDISSIMTTALTILMRADRWATLRCSPPVRLARWPRNCRRRCRRRLSPAHRCRRLASTAGSASAMASAPASAQSANPISRCRRRYRRGRPFPQAPRCLTRAFRPHHVGSASPSPITGLARSAAL